jgi:betaine lipid synthase
VLHGAKQVVSVDCNPAQTALLELKKLAIERLDYEDVWQLFGEGKHPNFKHIFLTKLGPFMTEKSFMFWQKRCALQHSVLPRPHMRTQTHTRACEPA